MRLQVEHLIHIVESLYHINWGDSLSGARLALRGRHYYGLTMLNTVTRCVHNNNPCGTTLRVQVVFS